MTQIMKLNAPITSATRQFGRMFSCIVQYFVRAAPQN